MTPEAQPGPPLDRAERHAPALLRDPDFTRLLDEDFDDEQRGDVDAGLNREELLAKHKHLLDPPED